MSLPDLGKLVTPPRSNEIGVSASDVVREVGTVLLGSKPTHRDHVRFLPPRALFGPQKWSLVRVGEGVNDRDVGVITVTQGRPPIVVEEVLVVVPRGTQLNARRVFELTQRKGITKDVHIVRGNHALTVDGHEVPSLYGERVRTQRYSGTAVEHVLAILGND
jgi:hypothetical protein